MNKFRAVLAIDGGGIRGLFAASVLAAVERMIGKPLGQTFDLVAGTSTGGIIALAAGAGLPMADIAALYRTRAATIFHRSPWHALATGGGLWGPRYDGKGLAAALAEAFGDRSLAGIGGRVLVTAYDLERRKPHFFKSWKAREDADEDFRLLDAALATSAAPVYFPPASIRPCGHAKESYHYRGVCLPLASIRPQGGGGALTLIDGGIGNNNPSLCALAEAGKLWPEPVLLLSVGSGVSEQPYFHASGWGLAGWAAPLLDCMFDAQSDTAAYVCGLQLGRNHLRINCVLPCDIPMDSSNPDALRSLEYLAEAVVEGRRAEIERLIELLGYRGRQWTA